MLNASIQDNRTTRPQGATRGEVFLAGGKTTGREKHAGGPPREARRMDLKARRSSEKITKIAFFLSYMIPLALLITFSSVQTFFRVNFQN